MFDLKIIRFDDNGNTIVCGIEEGGSYGFEYTRHPRCINLCGANYVKAGWSSVKNEIYYALSN